MKRIKTLVVLLLFLVMAICPGYGLSLQPDQTVQLSKGSYTLENLFKTLETVPNLKISYNASTLPMDMKVDVEKTNPTLKELITYIEKSGRVEGIINDNYLVFRLKKLEKEYHIKGVVNDSENGEPILGVNVYIKGTGKGVVTNVDGGYSLAMVQGTYILVFSFIGFSTQEIEVSFYSDQTLNIQLNPIKTELTEIKITAQRKFFGNMEYGREIPIIDSKEIEKLSTNNASDILHARLAGVWGTKTSGAPGDQQKIRIRGQASFFSSAEPLYVIDGVPVPIVNLASLGISDLNTNDIESITVLKDASSTALYGYQGGNGVILIDTKQKSENKLNFSYKSGIQWFNNFYNLMGTKDFLESLDYARKTISSSLRNFYPAYSDTLCDHNRQAEIFKLGVINEVNLSGGGQRNSYKCYWSGSYIDHKGILSGSEYKRGTVTMHVGRSFGKKLAMDLSYRGSYQYNKNNQNEYGGNRIIFEGINKSPCLEDTPDSLIYNSMGARYKRIHYRYGVLNNSELLQDIIDESNVKLTIQNHAASIMGRYSINQHWSINAIESMLYRKTRYNSDSWKLYEYQYETTKLESYLSPIIFTSDEEVRLINHQVNLTYNQSFGAHNLGLVVAQRYYADNLWWNVDTMLNSLPEHYSLRNSMAGYGLHGSVIRRLSSYIAHVSYNFRKTYYLSAVANLSRLKEGLCIDYYTLFPSVSLTWELSQEPFLSGVKEIDELSVYTNYGTSGNYPLNGLSNDLYSEVSYSDGSSTSEGNYYVSLLANHYLKHESTTEFDIGLKSSLFKNRLKVSAAGYNKQIGNQIIKRNIPYYYGGGEMYLNLGDIEVNGYEIGFEAIPVQRKDLNIYLMGNFSSSKQRVSRIADDQDMIFYTKDELFPEFIVKENEQLGDIYGYRCMGKWDNSFDTKQYYKLGNMAFLNNDTTSRKLNEDDKVVIGNSIPDFTWNFIASFQYKNFSLDLSLYSVWGVDKYNATRAGTIMTGLNKDVLGFYKDTLTAIIENEFYESSLFIEDASFVRLKTVTIGYEPDKKFWNAQWNFSLAFENLLTFTKYKGYDPEATIYTDNNFSDNAIDRGAYPSPRSIIFKIGLKF